MNLFSKLLAGPDSDVNIATGHLRQAHFGRRPGRSGRVAVSKRHFLLLPALVAVLLGVGVSSAWGAVGWTVHAAPEPSSFSSGDGVGCGVSCDRYQLLLQNNGDEASKPGVKISDVLPHGLTLSYEAVSGSHVDGVEWECSGEAPESSVLCSFPESIPAGGYSPRLTIYVVAPSVAMEQEFAATKVPLKNTVTVEGGGASPVTSVQESVLDKPAAFELNEFAFDPQLAGGASASAAGGHPWQLTTTFGVPSQQSPYSRERNFEPVHDFKSVAVELPAGVVGDPLATARCTESELREGHCPAASAVGVFALQSGSSAGGIFESTGEFDAFPGVCCSVVYDLVPEAGYPAEFGFDYGTTIPITFYANVVHTGTGYRVRVTVPGVGVTKALIGTSVTFFGDPGASVLRGGLFRERHESEPVAPASETAFLSDPSDCTAEAEGLSGESHIPRVDGLPVTADEFASRLELEPWYAPGPEHVIHGEDQVFSSLSGCSALAGLFNPKVGLAPSPAGSEAATQEGTSQADEPSAYSVDVKLPQTTGFSESATPDLRNATVALPAGVSVSPSAATGLVGCQAEGSEGINVGSSDIGAGGQDLGDPDATEFGDGTGGAGGNGSPYDDGFYHTAAGHCPGASTLGTVEICTPLLPNTANALGEKVEGVKACEEGTGTAPLKGHVYVAQPKCGGEGQPACTEASATNGELFGIYIEASGSGVIVKLPGTVAANPANGQLTTTFAENPQLPFNELKLHLHGGGHASLANPQSCGSFATSSTLTSWAGQSVVGSSPAFAIDSNGAGGACPATDPFGPTFTAGTTSTQAGGSASFVLGFSRQDREQDLAGLTETMPPGLIGKIAGIPLCGEAEANAGTCSQASEVGTTTATAGPGPEPYVVTGGHVYLTGPYHGAPFGLSIVVPTKAGPFNLGNEVVRATISINPSTAQVTTTTNPLPQKKDGVPFRLRAINTEINRPGFIVNPTSCNASAITGTLSGSQGAAAAVSSPFNATGCAALPFKPGFSITTSAKTSKENGASLTVKVTQQPGEANIHKVDLTIPTILPARLTTLNKACTEAQFNADPAGCPEKSFIGTAVAHTPLLNNPLMGPAIIVSHGGAAFPDVEYVLQGEGIVIVLDGKTDIKKGITYSNFETVPDAPISSFETVLGEGSHSILTTTNPGVTNLCAPTTTKTETVKEKVTVKVRGKKRKETKNVKRTVAVPTTVTIPTSITGQNGAVLTQSTKVKAEGCAKATTVKKAKPKAKKKKKHARGNKKGGGK
jgi:hypothetical protein